MLRAGDIVICASIALLALGVVMVASAGMAVGPAGGPGVTLESVLLSRSTAYMAIALVALFACSRLPLDRLLTTARGSWWAPLLLPVCVGLLALVYVPGIGIERNGAARWIALPGGLTFQPSEVAKWAMIVVLAWYAWRRSGALHRFGPGLLPAVLALGIVTAIVTKEDLGTGALIGATGVAILVAAGARLWHFVLLAPAALLGLLAALVRSPYRLERLRAYLDPYEDPDGAGYHIIQSLVAIANGSGAGRGLGHGLQKFGYLPEDRTDFLFAVVCEELGVAGAALVTALYAALLLAGLSIMRRQTHPMLKLVALGVVTTLGLQTLINLTVVTGLAPTKGIALPLMSAGGTGWILTAAALGSLVAMDRLAPVSAPEADAETTPAPAPGALAASP